MQCEKVLSRKRQVCAGDLDKLISLQRRDIVAVEDGVNYTMSFELIEDLWASCETRKGITVFDSTNTEIIIDATFYIPFIENVTAESWILFEGIRYDIMRVEDLELRHEWLALYCISRGTDESSVNAQ